MTHLRRKRLLMLAITPNANHKRRYSQYCELMREGLVMWQLGTAFLTDKGQDTLTAYILEDMALADRGFI